MTDYLLLEARQKYYYLLFIFVRVIKSKILRWAGHVAKMEKDRSVFKILIGKYTGKRPSGRFRRGWEENIRMDLKKRDQYKELSSFG